MDAIKKFRARRRSPLRTILAEEPPAGGRQDECRKLVEPPVVTTFSLLPLTCWQADECWRLDRRCFAPGEAYSRETLEHILNGPEAACYRAVTKGGRMAGFVIAVVAPDESGHILSLGVAPEHRRRGLARLLMEKVETYFRRLDIDLVRLEVRTNNTAAQQLYLGLGYRINERLPHYYAAGEDALVMAKHLKEKL